MRGNLALRAVPSPIPSGGPDDETGEHTAPSSQPGAPGAGALRAGETGAEAPAIRRGRLLIVDDEVVFSGSLRRLFSNEHDVTVVNRGSEALGRLRGGERFDAILCDLLMPEVTGVELYTELRQIAPDQADCMIFLTGGAFSESSQQFLDGVSNRWFEKPCNLDLLRAAVREVVVRNGGR